MWTLVLFFGASVLFTSVRSIARDESTGFQIGAQAVAGLLLIGRDHGLREAAHVRPLAEQTILVTGSTDGHGRRVAEELVGAGASVIVHGRDPERTSSVARAIGADRAAGGRPLLAGRGSADGLRGGAARHAREQRRDHQPGAAGEPGRGGAHARRELPLALPPHRAAPRRPARARAHRERGLARAGPDGLRRPDARAGVQRVRRLRPEQAGPDHLDGGAGRAARATARSR